MSKPIVFFSHSSKDQAALQRLKQLFCEKTGGSIDIFLSSDGQSIPLGRNWVHKIQEALENASLVITFVSPSSLRSSWLYFESGYAYSKSVRVVPVGFLGVDIGSLPPPLSLLQGFNITGPAGLDNLIALANETFKHAHSETFSETEFAEVDSSGRGGQQVILGNHAHAISRFVFHLDYEEDTPAASAAFRRIELQFSESGVAYERTNQTLSTYGLDVVHAPYAAREFIAFTIDPGIADVVTPLVERTIGAIRSRGAEGIRIDIAFFSGTYALAERHSITGRLYGSDVKLAPEHSFIRGDLTFRVELEGSYLGPMEGQVFSTTLRIHVRSQDLPMTQVRELLDLLFDKGILYYRPDDLH